MKSNILYLNNLPYENGKVSGEYFKDKVKINIDNVKKILNNDNIKHKIIKQFNTLKNQYPRYCDEVIGKADGLGIDRLLYFAVLCPEITDIDFEHCTTIMCKNNEKIIISHNEDDEYLEGNFCLSKVKIDKDN